MKTKNMMKRAIQIIPYVLVISFFMGCSPETTVEPNNAPGTFSVSVANITATSATLNWTNAVDPDGDAVSYKIVLGNTTLATDENGNSYDLSSLQEGESYSGEVIAQDGNGGETSTSFSFNTGGNQNPGMFTVTPGSITGTGAALSWNAPVDSDGDNLTYSVTLEGTSLVSGLTITNYTLSDLTANTDYNGSVIADDGNGGTSTAAFSFSTTDEQDTYVLDPDLFTSSSFSVEAKLVDCQLENGSNTKCYELVFISNPVDDDGPFCPETLDDIGGMGIYDGATNPGFQVMKRALFEAMENDGYDIVDKDGNIRTSDFSGMDNPNFDYCLHPLADDNLILKFTIPAIPEMLTTPNTIESVELIGVSVDGVPMNGEPPSVTTGPMGNGNIPSLDPCGGHADPSGYYHWHFISESVNEILTANGLDDISCTNTTQDNTALSGFAKDGYPIYASACKDGEVPSDLDECNGHTAITNEYPNGIYHYHASSTDAPNMPPCIKGAAVNNPFVVD